MSNNNSLMEIDELKSIKKQSALRNSEITSSGSYSKSKTMFAVDDLDKSHEFGGSNNPPKSK